MTVRKRPAEDAVDGPSKKARKSEPGPSNGSAGPDRAQLQKQSLRLFGFRDRLKQSLQKPELVAMLEENGQEVPQGVERVRTGDGVSLCP